jgi:hypothetical protein
LFFLSFCKRFYIFQFHPSNQVNGFIFSVVVLVVIVMVVVVVVVVVV